MDNKHPTTLGFKQTRHKHLRQPRLAVVAVWLAELVVEVVPMVAKMVLQDVVVQLHFRNVSLPLSLVQTCI